MVKQIFLNGEKASGLFALVDDCDFELLSACRWHLVVNTYAGRNVREGEKYSIAYMHRVIMNAPKGVLVDHINHNPLDNRRENLRLCSHAQNMRNKRMHPKNKTGFRGVSVHPETGKYRATIRYQGKTRHIGLFETAESAATAWNEKALEIWGEFASLNLVQS